MMHNENQNNYVKGWLDHYNLVNARFSDYFVSQLEWHHFNRVYNVFSILDEIKYLEGRTNVTATKPATRFKHEPLKGFWHKHHFQARFIPTNIINFWELRNGMSKKFGNFWTRVLSETQAMEMNDVFVNLLTYELVFGAFKKRVLTDKNTGEWIVFARHNRKNYYLTLANHTESDTVLYGRMVANCGREFPFLFNT